MLTIKIKIYKTKIQKEKKEYIRNYYYKRKSLLNHLINRVQGLGNANLKKSIFKHFKSIKKQKVST